MQSVNGESVNTMEQESASKANSVIRRENQIMMAMELVKGGELQSENKTRIPRESTCVNYWNPCTGVTIAGATVAI